MAALAVIIPARDAAGTVAATLESILTQTAPPEEVIVVDDGSSDATVAVVQSVVRGAAGPVRVRIVRSDAGNAATSRNLGALCTSAERLVFVDADDLLVADTLEALGRALDDSAAGFALAPWFRFEPSGSGWLVAPPSCRPRGAEEAPLDAWLRGWYHPPASIMWRRDAFERAGRFEEGLAVNQDGDLVLRALASGIQPAMAAGGAVLYRRHPRPAASVSGARLTERGLRARLHVVRKIGCWLDDLAPLGGPGARDGWPRPADRASLAGHRRALRAAAQQIAADAEGAHPAIAAEADALARPHVPAGLRPWMRRAERRLDACRRPHRSATPIPPPATPDAPATPARTGDGDDARHEPGRACVETVDRPTVSVVIPTYQRAHLVGRAVRSALAQTWTDLEVLVVDDGSTDDTADVVAAIDDPRVRYLRQRVNAGVAAARNRAMRESRGRYLAFLDSDDTWYPDKLERQLALFDHHRHGQGPGLVYGGVASPGPDGWQVDAPAHRGRILHDLLERNVVHGGGSNVVIPRQVVAQVGFFDERLPAIEDYDYWLRVARHHAVDAVDGPVMRYEDPADPDATSIGEPARKSADNDANHRARRMFHRKHRRAMRAAGTEHVFLVESARRLLTLAPTSRRRAAGVALRAVWARPSALTPWRVLGRSMLPGGVRPAVAPTHDSDRPRVLVYSPTPSDDTGGVQNAVQLLVDGFVGRGMRVEQFWSSTPDGRQRMVLPLPELRGVRRSWSSAAVTLTAALGLGRRLRRSRPDVVAVHYLDATLLHFLLWRPLFGYRIVATAHGSDVTAHGSDVTAHGSDVTAHGSDVTAHGSDVTAHGSDVATPGGGRSTALLRRWLHRVDALVAVDDALADRLAAYPGVSRERVTVVPNGIDVAFWSAASKAPAHDAPRPRVVCVGRLEAVKGHDVVLDAMAHVLAELPDAELVVVGSGRLAQVLRAQADRLGLDGSVRLLGRRDHAEVRELLASATVFALPSRSEGMPLALLEAMATGVAVVASDVGAVGRVLGSECGRVVPPGRPDELATALIELLAQPDLARALGERGALRASDFAAEHTVRAHTELVAALARTATAGRSRRVPQRSSQRSPQHVAQRSPQRAAHRSERPSPTIRPPGGGP